MFGLSTFKLAAIGLAALAVVTIIGLAYRHYTGLINDKVVAEANVAKLEVALATEQATVAALKANVDEWKQAAERYQKAAHEAQLTAKHAKAETRRLNALFSEHDFTNLARRKPGLIERRINSSVRRAGSLLECATTPGGCGGDGDRGSARAPADSAPTPRADASGQVAGDNTGESPQE